MQRGDGGHIYAPLLHLLQYEMMGRMCWQGWMAVNAVKCRGDRVLSQSGSGDAACSLQEMAGV
jgi:hypothetical protein